MKRSIKVLLWIIGIVLFIPFFYYVMTPCCEPRITLACRYCPGITDDECESWMTENKGICIEKGDLCKEGYTIFLVNVSGNIKEAYLCPEDQVCCLPEDFQLI